MKTAEDVIMDFQELTQDQKEKVITYVISTQDQLEINRLNEVFDQEYIREENYSQEDLDKINHDADEAKRGINISGPFKNKKEALNHLDRLMKENTPV